MLASACGAARFCACSGAARRPSPRSDPRSPACGPRATRSGRRGPWATVHSCTWSSGRPHGLPETSSVAVHSSPPATKASRQPGQSTTWAGPRTAPGALGPALRSLDEAERRYLDLGVRLPQVAMDRCAVLLAAGLFEEAFQEINTCVESFAGRASRSDLRADAALMAARAALPRDARVTRFAMPRLRNGSMSVMTTHAPWRWPGSRAYVPARPLRPRRASALATARPRCREELDSSGSPEAVGAALLAGRAAAAAGDRETALAQWRRAAAGRRAGTALDRVSGWLAVMLSAELGGSRSGVLAAAESGMRVLDTHRLSLGATELRAYATEHGRELADGALRQVVDRGDAWALLRWTERWRATVIDVPVSRPATDPELGRLVGRAPRGAARAHPRRRRHARAPDASGAARTRGARPVAPGLGLADPAGAPRGPSRGRELCARRHGNPWPAPPTGVTRRRRRGRCMRSSSLTGWPDGAWSGRLTPRLASPGSRGSPCAPRCRVGPAPARSRLRRPAGCCRQRCSDRRPT